MATLTAQILVGHGHPNHDGINPTHYLFFSQNDRSAWVLLPENIFDRNTARDPVSKKTIWHPTMENALEDALLMIAVYVLREPKTRELAMECFYDFNDHRVELHKDNVLESDLQSLYEHVRNINAEYKIVVTTLKGSPIEVQLPVLEKYSMDVEVCTPIYSRLYSRWEKRTKTEGSL